MPDLIAPRRGDPFVDDRGVPLVRPMFWIEEASRLLNTNTADVLDRIIVLEADVEELEPQYRVVTSADSPVSGANNDYILADMSAGDVIITLPSSGRLHVTRAGASNTLTLTGTVEGETDPTIIADGDAPALAYIGTEWRYV